MFAMFLEHFNYFTLNIVGGPPQVNNVIVDVARYTNAEQIAL